MQGQVVLVTGATRGIGREVARQLAALGATVLVSARSAADAAATAAELEGDVRALEVDLDVADGDQVAIAARALERDPGRLDVLVNNAAAAVDRAGGSMGADLATARSAMDTNLFGAWRMSQAVFPLLQRSAHPRIVNVSSGAGCHGEPDGLSGRGGAAAGYGISTAALNALTSTLAAELAHTPILVNAVCPGATAASGQGGRPVAEGAASVVWAATLPDEGPRGGLFRDGAPLRW